MNVRTYSCSSAPDSPRRLVASLAAVLSLTAIASSASAFSTGSPVCKVTSSSMAAGQGAPLGGGSGGFVVEALRAGTPTTTMVPGETLQIRVSHPANALQRGVLIWVDNPSGTSIGSFTPGSGTQLTPGCGTTSLTHTNANPVSVRTVSWTVPSNQSGNATLSVVIVAGSRNDWYGPLTTTLSTAAPTAVPGLRTWTLVLTGLALVATSYRRARAASA